MMYNTKQKNQKQFYFKKLCTTTDKKDFLRRSVEYSGSWCECPRVFKLTQFLCYYEQQC